MANWKASVPILGFKLYTCRYKVTMPSELHRSFNLCWDPKNQIATPVPHPSLLLQFHELLASTHGVKPHLSFNPNQRGDWNWGRWPETPNILQLFCWKLIFTINKLNPSTTLQMNVITGWFPCRPLHVSLVLASESCTNPNTRNASPGISRAGCSEVWWWNIPGGWLKHPRRLIWQNDAPIGTKSTRWFVQVHGSPCRFSSIDTSTRWDSVFELGAQQGAGTMVVL